MRFADGLIDFDGVQLRIKGQRCWNLYATHFDEVDMLLVVECIQNKSSNVIQVIGWGEMRSVDDVA